MGIPWRLRGARLDAQRGGPRGSLCGFQSMASLLNEERGGEASTPTFSAAVVVVETQPCWCFPRNRGNTTKHREGSLRDGGHKRCGEDG